MFERVWILSVLWGTTSLRRSIELPFERTEKETVVTATQTLTGYAPLRRQQVRPSAPGLQLRMTRRGRLLLLGILAAVLLLTVSVGRMGSQAATAVDNGPALTQTTVQPGDTLWAVARRLAPGSDARQVIAQIRRVNHLADSTLYAGQQLLLPAAP